MPKRNDGNEQDLRVRPFLDAPSLEKDNPFTGAIPPGKDPCNEGHGEQEDLVPEIQLPDQDPLLYDWKDLSELCPRGFSNRAMNRLILAVLKNHFSNPRCISNPVLRQFLYSENPSDSGIRIVMNTTFDPASAGQMPSLIVKRGEQKMQRVSIGDYNRVVDVQRGRSRYSRFQTGLHSILTVGATDGFTEELAYEVYDLFNGVSPLLRRDLPLHDFQVEGMSGLGILENTGSTLGVAVQVSYAYEYSWDITDSVTPLRSVRMSLNTQLSSEEQP